MSLVMTELSNDVLHSPDPNFNPKVFSEDEEDDRNSASERNYSLHLPGGSNVGGGGAVPIAPMTPRRDGNRTRPINLTDGYGNHFVHLTRFIYTKPSAQRERVEIRKAVLENSILLRYPQLNTYRDNGRSSAEQSEDENNLSEPGTSKNCNALTAQINAQCEKINVQIENEPDVSPKIEPSVISNDTNSSNTYQGDNDRESKELTEPLSPSGKPESIEDETSYVDFNLTDVINFCENFKLNENHEKPYPVKRQERSETSFLNHQVGPPQRNEDSETAILPEKPECPIPLQSVRLEKKNGLPKPSGKLNAESIQFIDDDSDNQIDRMSRSCSVGFLDDVDTDCVAPCDSPVRISKRYPKRLFLVGGPSKKDHNFDHLPKSKSNLLTCGKSRSLDSSDLFSHKGGVCKKLEAQTQPEKESKTEHVAPKPETDEKESSVRDVRIPKTSELKEDVITRENIGGSNLCIAGSSIEPLPPPSPRLPRSQPVTPALSKKKRNQSASPIR